MTPDEQELDIDFVDAPPAGGAPPKGPGRGRRILKGTLAAGRDLLGLVVGVVAFVLSLCVLGVRKIGQGIQKFKARLPKQKPKVTRKHMGLRHAFYGAAILAGAIVGPGVYHMTQPNEIVTTRVIGKTEADTDKEYPGRKWVIQTKEGNFDTKGVSGGGDIRIGCTYEFNLNGARINYWPLGYTRSVQNFKHVPTPGCPGN
ncbi:MAG: hypothetical protein ACAH80_08980 [Alphaproteobacteria bacterium]